MHSIAKSFLISVAQYNKLEKELKTEWELSVGWFRPSSLNAVTGETMRDKTKREQIQTSIKTIKEQRNQDLQSSSQMASTHKRVEKTSSSITVDSSVTGKQ